MGEYINLFQFEGRFTDRMQEDKYSGSLNDLSLSGDPLNDNRYDLGGGSPIKFVATEGHMVYYGGGGRGSAPAPLLTLVAAERAESLFPVPVSWRPVLLGGIFEHHNRGSWARTDLRGTGIATIETRAASRGLPKVRWPYPFPSDGLAAMRVAAYADLTGRTRDFALAALRIHFVEGHSLSEWYAIARAVAAAELPKEAMEAPRDPAVKAHLRDLTNGALEAGVRGVPTVDVGGQLFWGDDRLEEAAAFARVVVATESVRRPRMLINYPRHQPDSCP